MKLKLFAVILFALFILSACRGDAITVTSTGETPSRIVVNAPSTAEILVGFGLSDYIVAVDLHGADIVGLDRETTTFIDFWNLNVEEVLILEPDLVIASELFQAGAEGSFELIQNAGIEVVYITDPSSMSEIFEQIELLGEILGRQREAAEMMLEMQNTLNYVAERIAEISEPRLVYFEINPAPSIFTFGGNTFLNELLTLGGGANIFADESGWFSPSEEAIILSNPDVILTNVTHVPNAVEEIQNRPGWWSVTAVISEDVHLINTNYTSRHSQFVARGVLQIATALHPELF